MSATVFITGGSGLLGLSWALATRDRYRVVLGLHQRLVALAGTAIEPVTLDSVDDVLRALDGVEPDVVVHTAGLANVDQCEAAPALAQRLNGDMAEHVAVACATRGVSLVHVSTDHLFRGDAAMVEETHPVEPQNVYAATKAEAERRVLAANPGALVVRTNFYGWGPRYRASFSDFIVDTLRRQEPVTLFNDIFYTPLLAEALCVTVHDLIDRGVTGIVHVSGDERISKHEFGLQIAAEFGLDLGLVQVGSVAGKEMLAPRPRDMSLSNAKVRGLLGRPLGGHEVQLARLRELETLGQKQELRTL